MKDEPLALLPELVLLLGAVGTLVLGSFLPRRRQWLARLAAAGVLLASLGLAIAALANGDVRTVYGATYGIDGPTEIARIVAPSAALLALFLAVDEVADGERETEFYVLVLLATLGSITLAGASDLALLAVAYLLASAPLHALAAHTRSGPGTEAALKTYLLSAFLNVALLLGAGLLFALAGGTTYADLAADRAGGLAASGAAAVGVGAVLVALMFKAGAVPGHFWVPDASEGASPAAAAVLTTVPKVGGLLAAYRLVDALPGDTVDVRLLVAVLAAVTMTLGNLAAFGQTAPRRLLGWSTVSQAGYLLMAVAVAGRTTLALPALGLYLAAYAVTNLGAFAITAALPQHTELTHYRGLVATHPGLAVALLVSLLGLVGTPPTAVFTGKLALFTATWDGGLAWLVVVAAINTVASLFYYLRWFARAFDRQGESGRPVAAARPWPRAAALTAAACSVLLGLAAGGVLQTDLLLAR